MEIYKTLKRITALLMLIGLMFGFTGVAEAVTGSIIDTFIDESMIALKENVLLETGQVKTPTYSWYATFSYNSTNYAWSGNTIFNSWNTMIPGYPSTKNPSGNGDVPVKGQEWCNDTFITSGWENDFNDWFLPNAYELRAGELYYTGQDPWNLPGTIDTIWSSETVNYYKDYNRAYVRWPGMGSSIDCRALKTDNHWTRPVRVITVLQGDLVSTNLLAGETVESVDSFGYDVSSIPAGTSLKVQFSQDNTNWYNASGLLGSWDSLSVGSNTIDLSLLDWSGNNFYYQMEFTSDALIAYAPVLDEISVNYSSGVIPEPASLLLLGFGVVGLVGFGGLWKHDKKKNADS